MARLARKQKIQNRFAAVQEGDSLDFEPYHFEVVLIPGHTPGSIALWEKEKRFLISGDSVTNATTFLFGEGRSLPAYLCSLRKLAAIAGQLDVIYGSHGPVEVPPTRINELIALCEWVERGEIHGGAGRAFCGRYSGISSSGRGNLLSSFNSRIEKDGCLSEISAAIAGKARERPSFFVLSD